MFIWLPQVGGCIQNVKLEPLHSMLCIEEKLGIAWTSQGEEESGRSSKGLREAGQVLQTLMPGSCSWWKTKGLR